MTRTLVVTNDFPPRPGGIQAYVHALTRRQPSDEVVVYAPAWPQAQEFDAVQGFPVVRHPGPLMLPVPDVLQRSRQVARTHGCDAVWFGAAAPLALLAPALRRTGVGRVVASTHGHELGWALLPGARTALRRIAAGTDVLTHLTAFTGRRLKAALGPAVRMEPLRPGVDSDVFTPEVDGSAVRQRWRLGDRPVVVCVSRLVPRKGQDLLVGSLPELQRRVPGVALLLVGSGPYEGRLRRLAGSGGVEGDVVFAGAVPWQELPAHYAAGDVFAMPCRTRRAGMDVEGCGLVYVEASASGLPVVAGRSGGAPETVREGVTGTVVDGRSSGALVDALAPLLLDRDLAARIGAAGRSWVQQDWRWETTADRLRTLLHGA